MSPRDSVGTPGEEERNEEEPSEEAKVLAGGDVIGSVVEVCAVENGVVEDKASERSTVSAVRWY
jgi:hypothetical protein